MVMFLLTKLKASMSRFTSIRDFEIHHNSPAPGLCKYDNWNTLDQSDFGKCWRRKEWSQCSQRRRDLEYQAKQRNVGRHSFRLAGKVRFFCWWGTILILKVSIPYNVSARMEKPWKIQNPQKCMKARPKYQNLAKNWYRHCQSASYMSTDSFTVGHIFSSGLDMNCKRWRLFADVVNDLAMCIELIVLPFFFDSALPILCVSTALKALVGVAGGATRAAITQHQVFY